MIPHKNEVLASLAVLLLIVFSGCGGGGGGSASNPVSGGGGTTDDTGTISGKVTPEEGSELSRAAGREAAATAINAKVYAHPSLTSNRDLKPNSGVPNTTTDSNGNYTITNVPVGTKNLVIDYDSDGIADERQFDVSVSKNSTTSAGTTEVAALNKDPKGSWCDVELDKVNYAPGETIKMYVRGYNYDTTSMKCGVKIILQKGQGQTQVWITDFNDTSTYVTMAAGSTASGTIEKVIPTTWEPTNSQAGSDYRVYTIRKNGTKWGKGDNFNSTCTAACSADSECSDGNSNTTDVCANPGACGALCSNVTCSVACASASACDDSNSLTTDTCNNAGTCSAACAHTQCDIACSSNSDCNDSNSTTTDVCVNSGTCEAACLNNPCEIECSSDTDCDDGNSLTKDKCNNPGMCYSSCTNAACAPACSSDADCNDSNPLTTDKCSSAGTCSAACSHTQCPVACSSDSDCNDSNSLTTDVCSNPGTCSAACKSTICSLECGVDAVCDVSGDAATTTEYLPLHPGNKWVYKSCESDNKNSPCNNYTGSSEIINVKGMIAIKNRIFYVLDNWLIYVGLYPESNCRHISIFADGEVKSIKEFFDEDTIPHDLTDNWGATPPVYFHWHAFGTSDYSFDGTKSIQEVDNPDEYHSYWDYSFCNISNEPITVPAGTFSDIRICTNGFAGNYMSVYFAKNIGPVKIVFHPDDPVYYINELNEAIVDGTEYP